LGQKFEHTENNSGIGHPTILNFVNSLKLIQATP
jgi:hypothetical protein